MEQKNPLVIKVELKAKNLWKFSMYHSYRGLLGAFNIIFSAAAIFLLFYKWSAYSVPYRILLIVCALMFTVWQPGILYLKACKQARTPKILTPMTLSFAEEGILVTQADDELELYWDNINRVERVWDMLIVYMDRVHAYLLPDSIMGERKDALISLIKEEMPPERRKRI
jgi:hypothetical protein